MREQSDGLVKLEDGFILGNYVFHKILSFPVGKEPFNGDNNDHTQGDNGEPTKSKDDTVQS